MWSARQGSAGSGGPAPYLLGGLRALRVVLTLSVVANLILALVSVAILPERVAIRFAWGGATDGWASRLASALLTVGLGTLLFLSAWLSPSLLSRTPINGVKLPNLPYSRSPERREVTIVRFNARRWAFGTALFLVLLAVELLTLATNHTYPVRLDQLRFLVGLALFLAYTLD
jgi:hypothetical protein